MIERIRCIPVICPWGLKFYSLSAQCEACYWKCLKLRQACARKGGSASVDASEGLAGEGGGRTPPPTAASYQRNSYAHQEATNVGVPATPDPGTSKASDQPGGSQRSLTAHCA